MMLPKESIAFLFHLSYLYVHFDDCMIHANPASGWGAKNMELGERIWNSVWTVLFDREWIVPGNIGKMWSSIASTFLFAPRFRVAVKTFRSNSMVPRCQSAIASREKMQTYIQYSFDKNCTELDDCTRHLEEFMHRVMVHLTNTEPEYVDNLKVMIPIQTMFFLHIVNCLMCLMHPLGDRDCIVISSRFAILLEKLEYTSKLRALYRPLTGSKYLLSELMVHVPNVLGDLIVSYCQLYLLSKRGEEDEELIMQRIMNST